MVGERKFTFLFGQVVKGLVITIAPYSQNKSTMDAIPPDAPAPRLCHVIKRPDFEGFGFNLFAGKVKTGQFIGKVDAGSPAEDAGLKPGDRIVEVNGVHIGNENHKQVKVVVFFLQTIM